MELIDYIICKSLVYVGLGTTTKIDLHWPLRAIDMLSWFVLSTKLHS